MKIKKGDKVKILKGKDRGKTGTVDKVFSKTGKILVGGLNVYKKHSKPRGEAKGGIFDFSRPLPASSVGLICPKCGKIIRVGYQVINGEKNRFCRECKSHI